MEIQGNFKDTIPVSTAIDITTSWRNYISTIDPATNYIRAFNIPMTDIAELATYHNCASVRAYLAMSKPNDISSLKIVLVPVDVNGKDITSISIPAAVNQSTVYDFTTPCPQICDINSPLFKAP